MPPWLSSLCPNTGLGMRRRETQMQWGLCAFWHDMITCKASRIHTILKPDWMIAHVCLVQIAPQQNKLQEWTWRMYSLGENDAHALVKSESQRQWGLFEGYTEYLNKNVLRKISKYKLNNRNQAIHFKSLFKKSKCIFTFLLSLATQCCKKITKNHES